MPCRVLVVHHLPQRTVLERRRKQLQRQQLPCGQVPLRNHVLRLHKRTIPGSAVLVLLRRVPRGELLLACGSQGDAEVRFWVQLWGEYWRCRGCTIAICRIVGLCSKLSPYGVVGILAIMIRGTSAHLAPRPPRCAARALMRPRGRAPAPRALAARSRAPLPRGSALHAPPASTAQQGRRRRRRAHL